MCKNTDVVIYCIKIFFVLQFFSCKSSSKNSMVEFEYSFKLPDSVNSRMNVQFKNTRKSFVGKVDSLELKSLYKNFDKNLNTKLSRDKAVLVNYKQKGYNCYDFDAKTLQVIASNGNRISKRMSKAYKIQDFFVYSTDAFYKELYESLDYYIEDSGFFKKNVFTLEEVCSAFLLVKPNGDFLKFYGTDYYSEVKNFMESELIIQSNLFKNKTFFSEIIQYFRKGINKILLCFFTVVKYYNTAFCCR